MDAALFSLVTLAKQWLRPRYNARMQLLEAQVRMLGSRIDASRIGPTPEEREELLRLGAAADHEVNDLIHVVLPETYKKWLRQSRGQKKFRPSGRPQTALATRRLVIRFANENMRWGCGRIVGELKKLGIRIGATTIRDILKREGNSPDPQKARKNPPIPWTTFVHANLDSIVACDFYAKRIVTFRGFRDAYVLAFIHLGSRRVYCSPSTYHPNSKWVMRQARQAAMWIEDEGITPKFIIRDRDGKYPDSFDAFWKPDVRCIRIPVRAPKANAFAESFIATTKREVLNCFVCFSRGQLDYIVTTWAEHYNTVRPHNGVGRDNTVLDGDFVPTSEGVVRRKTELGGILSSYYRDAA